MISLNWCGIPVLFSHGGDRAANFLFAKLQFAEQQLQRTANRSGVEILFPLVEQTFHNIKKYGWRKSLSGPLKRGETGLLKKHKSLLSGIEKKIHQLLLSYLQENPDD